MDSPLSAIGQVAQWLQAGSRVVVFTGAGVSTDSGIPDFRSPGGVWSQNRPIEFDAFLASPEARRAYWEQKSQAHLQFADAKPNAGHRQLAAWEAAGRIEAIITQNIDGLHQLAGSRRVLELHGTARRVDCLACGAGFDPAPLVQLFVERRTPPTCVHCGGLLKHATVSFGQTLPQEVLAEAVELSRTADLYLAIGSSLVVEPAASLPRLAHEHGARLVIINRDPTPLDDAADLCITTSISSTLVEIGRIIGPVDRADGD